MLLSTKDRRERISYYRMFQGDRRFCGGRGEENTHPLLSSEQFYVREVRVIRPQTEPLPLMFGRQIERRADGAMQLRLWNVPATGIAIEMSQDLKRWVPIATISGPADEVDWVDPSAVEAKRFYRAVIRDEP